jgi:pentatricopeptide repeat protein
MIVRHTFLRIISNTFSIKTKSSFNSPESTNQLIKTLNNHGKYDRAFQLFDMLIKQNNVTIKSLLTILDTCTRSGQIERARQIEIFINQSNKWKGNLRLQTSLINMYMKCQMIEQGNQ